MAINKQQTPTTRNRGTEMVYYRDAEIRATAYKAVRELAEMGKVLTYDNVLDITAYTLGIEMDDNDDYPVELYRKFDNVWNDLNK
ncbi:hypothetical protein PMS25_06100 [Bifidobacterium longum]|nr:hypothetical protein [Bifidobacterium longum]MDB6797116.1 hypothetical protein [Bifidobacterium longum]MDB6801052.1 hypothetical protein [Bifidobacterium longum]MDB6821214.1 hypothetical protein [Bifidobacterium longum]MDB6825089.1 hypothetical protein [Bifidobacterium longum]